MRLLILVLVAACGATPPPPTPQELDPSSGRAIRIQWRAEQADGGLVTVSLVVDGKAETLGQLDASTEFELGSPATCALRAAHPLRTEFLCGDLARYYRATLERDELVVTLVVDGEQPTEVKRIPVVGEGLSVAPYTL
ncbi:MAG: hypothetical protein HOV81_01365 [Kofleriaceae bacterium]|nr:hypothetical protein [Kofleriaceae bacterium]